MSKHNKDEWTAMFLFLVLVFLLSGMLFEGINIILK